MACGSLPWFVLQYQSFRFSRNVSCLTILTQDRAPQHSGYPRAILAREQRRVYAFVGRSLSTAVPASLNQAEWSPPDYAHDHQASLMLRPGKRARREPTADTDTDCDSDTDLELRPQALSKSLSRALSSVKASKLPLEHEHDYDSVAGVGTPSPFVLLRGPSGLPFDPPPPAGKLRQAQGRQAQDVNIVSEVERRREAEAVETGGRGIRNPGKTGLLPPAAC
jgi:hypothetical protein